MTKLWRRTRHTQISMFVCAVITLLLVTHRNTENKPDITNLQQISQRNNEALPASNKSCPRDFGSRLEDDIKQIMEIPVPPFSKSYLKDLGILTEDSIYDTTNYNQTLPVVVAACSADYFFTLQGLIKNLHEIRSVYPHLQIVFYDLGLTTQQRDLMVKYCKCEIKDFPFESFPHHIRHLKLYGWKAIVIQLALNDYGFVMYMDTSIRITSPYKLSSVFRHAKNTGFLYIREDDPRFTLVEHTDIRTFEYLGEIPCTFEGVPDRQAGFILITRSLFIQQLIMRPWLGCSLELECLSPQGAKERYVCDVNLHWQGKCHRYDQSIVNIVVSRLYHSPRKVPLVPNDVFKIKRQEHVVYFPFQ